MFADWGTAFRNCFSKGCAHMTVSNWDSRGALAVLQIPETPHLGLHSPNQHPRRPLKSELSPHGLSPLSTQRRNSSKHQDPWPRSQTQEVSEPGFKPRTLQLLLSPPPPTPTQAVRKHSGCRDASSGQLFSSEAWQGSVPTPGTALSC